MDARPRHVQDALQYASDKLSIKFRKQQEEALSSFLLGHDVFISLPTGFGKGLVFRSAPFCRDFLRSDQDEDGCSLAIVVMPLKSLIRDQLDIARKSGISAIDLSGGMTDKIREELSDGHHSLILSSPEFLTGDSGKELMTVRTVKDRLCGLFVDESHCVMKWGQSMGKTKAFRASYDRIGELRSILPPVPIVALTATATQEVRRSILDSLSMSNYVVIAESPDKPNIKHCFLRSKSSSPDKNLSFLVKEVKEKGKDCDRVIIYCQSRSVVSDVYSMFLCHLPESHQHIVQMYHTNTENDVQETITKDLGNSTGQIRILVATIAFGMGVDVQGCWNVLMYGVPGQVEDYIQMAGRVGRDGGKCACMSIKYPGDRMHGTSAEMKQFIAGEICRRSIILHSFGVPSRQSVTELHDCCDVCALECKCDGTSCSQRFRQMERLAHEALVGPTVPLEFKVSIPSAEDRKRFESSLEEYRCSLVGDASESLYTGADLACGFPSSVAEKMLRDVNVIIPKAEFLKRYRFGNTEIGEECWRIYSKFAPGFHFK